MKLFGQNRGKIPMANHGWLNSIMYGHEISTSILTSRSFADWAQQGGLIDPGVIGTKFTWKLGNDVLTRRSAPLDRDLCVEEWRCLSPKVVVRYLPHFYSVHCPQLFQLKGSCSTGLGIRPFHFQAARLAHKGFLSFTKLEREWGCLNFTEELLGEPNSLKQRNFW